MTAKNPENQSDSRPRGGAAGGLNARQRTAAQGQRIGAQGQRIFVSGDKIVEKPPVLFRMPSVKLSVAGSAAAGSGEPLSDPIGGGKKTTSAPPNSSQLPAESQPSAASPTHQGPRAPHFLTSSGGGDSSGAGKIDPVKVAARTTDKRKGSSVDDQLASTPAVSSQSEESERSLEKTPKSQRNTSIPEVSVVPAGRGWMEIIGSRLVIVLLVAAIAAVAILANRESSPQSAAELAILELGSSENGDASKMSDNPLASGGLNEPIAGGTQRNNANVGSANGGYSDSGSWQPNASASSGLTAPIRTAQANAASSVSTPSNRGTQSVEPVNPDFQLADLLGSGDFENGEGQPTSSTSASNDGTFALSGVETDVKSGVAGRSAAPSSINPPSLSGRSQDGPSQELIGATPQLNGAPAGPKRPEQINAASTSGSHWQQELEQLGASVGVDGTGAKPNASASSSSSVANQSQENRWINEPTVATSNAGSANFGPSNTGSESEVAIRAAIDAAMINRTSEGQVQADIQTIAATSQPAGISDWSRYLPSSNLSNSPSGQAPQMMAPQGPGNLPQPGYQPQSYPGQAYPGANGVETFQPGQQPGVMDQPGVPRGSQPNMLPPGTINPPSGYQGRYPAQAFTGGLPYSPGVNAESQYNGTQPRTAMLPSGANSGNPQTLNGFTIPPIGYGQPGVSSDVTPAQTYPASQYPSSYGDPNRR